MKKRLFALLLAAMMLLSVTPTALAADKPGGDGNIGGEIFDEDPIILPWSLTAIRQTTSGKTHTAAVKVTGKETATVILAAYSSTGKMLAADMKTANLFSGTATLELSVSCTEPIAKTTLILLDANYIPVTDALT